MDRLERNFKGLNMIFFGMSQSKLILKTIDTENFKL